MRNLLQQLLLISTILVFLNIVSTGNAMPSGENVSVGRLNHAEYSMRSHCTGTLIAKDMVLTAAHCLISPKTGNPFKPNSVIFRAGYDYGESIADVSGVKFLFLNGYLETKDKGKKLNLDVAIVFLKREVEIKPRKVAVFSDDLRKFEFMGYSRKAAHRLSNAQNCTKERESPSLIVLNCATSNGQSGGPVLAGSGEIYGIVVGKTQKNNAIILKSKVICKLRNLSC